MTRADVQAFKVTLKPARTDLAFPVAGVPSAARFEVEVTAAAPAPAPGGGLASRPVPSAPRDEAGPTSSRNLVLLGEVAGASVRVLLDGARVGDGQVFVVDSDGGPRRVVAINLVGCLRLGVR